MLMNNDRIHELAGAMAARISGDVLTKVKMVYQIALSRMPTEEETRLGVTTLTELQTAAPEGGFASYCHAILNSAGFIYLD